VIDYIGIPYVDFGRDANGFDCWGLVMQIYKDKGITLKDYAYESPEDVKNNESIYKDQYLIGDWRKESEPSEGDIIVFNIAGYPSHVGVIIDKYRFIHAHKSCGVAIEKINSVRWRNRVHGFYSHRDSVQL